MLRDRAPKASGTGPHRETSPELVFQRMQPYLRHIGVTRIADITGLDRVGIPVFNAVCPRSKDVLSVYNGKGRTAAEARTSAVMEAAERYGAALPRTPACIASFPQLAEADRPAVDPRDCNLELFAQYGIDMPISWVEGYDLVHERTVLVPLYLAGYYMQFHETPCYSIATTNGIASGSSLEEAICHALAEVIERDDWTMADLVSNRLGQALVGGDFFADAGGLVAAWLRDRHPSIDLTTLPESAQHLVERFRGAHLTVELKNLTSPTGIATVMATVTEQTVPTFSHSHRGLGTHPDAEVAVLRALTEVAQSRAVDISAVREDIALPGESVSRWSIHSRRTSEEDATGWSTMLSSAPVRFSDLPSFPSDDIVADVRLMVDRLAAQGLPEVVVVDLSPPTVPASVVRVIVPGLESWAADRSKLGQRARSVLDGVLAQLMPTTDPAPAGLAVPL